MNPRTKTLCLVLTALVSSLALASTASAGEFTAKSYPATITGTELSQHQFSFFGWTIGCNEARFHSKLAAASKTMTVGAEYGDCSTPGGQEAIVSMESCDFVLRAGETIEKDKVDGTLDVKCAEAEDGIHFEVPASGCTAEIHAQTQLSTLVYTDHTEAGDFDVDFGIGASIKYTQDAQCPGGAGFYFNGEYSGESTIIGEKEGGVEVDVTVD